MLLVARYVFGCTSSCDAACAREGRAAASFLSMRHGLVFKEVFFLQNSF